MSDPITSGGSTSSPGGTSESDPNKQTNTNSGNPGEGTPPPENKDTVAYATYAKLLDEKKARDKELADYRKQIDDRKAAEKVSEEAKLREAGEYQKLLKLREEELAEQRAKTAELEGKLTATEERKQNGLRARAFMDHLSGELEEAYWPLVDLTEIPIDPATGLPDKLGAMKVAREFEQKHPLVIRKPGSSGGLPGTAAKGSSAQIGFDAEIRAAKNQKELDAVLKKHGKAQ